MLQRNDKKYPYSKTISIGYIILLVLKYQQYVKHLNQNSHLRTRYFIDIKHSIWDNYKGIKLILKRGFVIIIIFQRFYFNNKQKNRELKF